jgi:mycofactocin precursor
LFIVNLKEITLMFIPVEQLPTTPVPHLPPALATPKVSALATGDSVQRTETLAELPQIEEELLIEEVSIDGMCGVY